jgi:hypothetical protein
MALRGRRGFRITEPRSRIMKGIEAATVLR